MSLATGTACGGWKQEHPKKFHMVTNLGAVFGFGLVIGLVFLAGLPPVSPWLVPSLAPFYPVLWIVSMPRPYKAPRVSAA
jgi:hypothetical protein